MACKLVLVPSFPGLLDLLLHQLRTSCLEDPLGPKWVVVPTSTAANHLRVRLGREAGEGVLGGVRVVPVANFIDRLGSRDGEPCVRRWDCALDLLLFELVEQLPPSSPLVGLHRMTSGYRLLRPTFLDLAGYEVIDLGHDISNEIIIEAIEQENPAIVGLSALMTTTMLQQREFIKALEQKGLRDKVKVIVGGAPINQAWVDEIGADAFGADALDARNRIDSLLGF